MTIEELARLVIQQYSKGHKKAMLAALPTDVQAEIKLFIHQRPDRVTSDLEVKLVGS